MFLFNKLDSLLALFEDSVIASREGRLLSKYPCPGVMSKLFIYYFRSCVPLSILPHISSGERRKKHCQLKGRKNCERKWYFHFFLIPDYSSEKWYPKIVRDEEYKMDSSCLFLKNIFLNNPKAIDWWKFLNGWIDVSYYKGIGSERDWSGWKKIFLNETLATWELTLDALSLWVQQSIRGFIFFS